MKKVLFATNNYSKVKRFYDKLLDMKIELLSLRDLEINMELLEDGNSAIENALIKARSVASKVDFPVIGLDDTLYMEGVPDDKQPGLYVRRVGGKTLSDEEMIDYYTNLVKKYGVDGKINCKWIYGLAVISENGEESTYTWFKDNFYMVDIASSKINPGYPLNSISKYKKIDKYFTDITDDDRNLIRVNEDDVIDFIFNHV